MLSAVQCTSTHCTIIFEMIHKNILNKNRRESKMQASLKGVWHEIFDFKFFSWISVPQAPKYSIEAFLNFFENSRRYSRIPVISCSVVSTTRAKNLSPVSLTPVNNLYFPGVDDTVQKKTKNPKIYRRCQRHCRKIVHRCQRHRW